MDGLNNRPIARTIRRVKTGCRTCKARRVKCDEQRPSCRRCTSTSRACMGYGGDLPSHPDLHLHRPSNAGPVGRLGAQDRLLLEWFMQANLQGVFPFPFWENLVPQACYSEPAVLSCVLALGSAHRRACVAKWSKDAQSEVENLEATGLRHYNTAITLLKGAKLERSRASTRVTLTACLSFVIIEYLHRRPAQALVHLQHGLQILQDNHMRQHASDPVDDWLAEAFDRLDVQAKLLFNKTGDSKSCQNAKPKGKKFLKLTSLHEARQHLDLLLSDAYRLQHQGRVAESSADTSLLFQALIAQQQLQDDLRSWLQAYRTWCARPSPCSSQPSVAPPEHAARRLLLIYHTMLGIVTATALYSEDESVFDRHTLQFASIVAMSKEVLQIYQPVITSPTSSAAHCTRQFTFTSDLGLVPVLYYTALKCRDPELRDAAVSMLDTQTHQEGIWEGPTAALIVAEMIRLEQESPEGDIDKGMPLGSSVPQLWRVSDVQVELPDIYGTELVVSCRRKSKNGAWINLERRYDGVSWY